MIHANVFEGASLGAIFADDHHDAKHAAAGSADSAARGRRP
jgi:hypothetical protein